MGDVSPAQQKGNVTDDQKIISSTAEFSIALFQKSMTKDTNCLISPMSVYFALGMTANGADKNTLKQFQDVLDGGIGIDELNINYNKMVNSLESMKDGKIKMANSVWYRSQNLGVKKEFSPEQPRTIMGRVCFSLILVNLTLPIKSSIVNRNATHPIPD